MAKVVTGDIIIFDGTDQGEGLGPYMDSQKSVYEPEGTAPALNETVVYRAPLQIKQIKVVTGSTGGDVLLYSRKVAGTADVTEENKPDERKRYEILFLDDTPANDTLWVPMDIRVDGIYVDTLPTGAKLYVYLGD